MKTIWVIILIMVSFAACIVKPVWWVGAIAIIVVCECVSSHGWFKNGKRDIVG